MRYGHKTYGSILSLPDRFFFGIYVTLLLL